MVTVGHKAHISNTLNIAPTSLTSEDTSHRLNTKYIYNSLFLFDGKRMLKCDKIPIIPFRMIHLLRLLIIERQEHI